MSAAGGKVKEAKEAAKAAGEAPDKAEGVKSALSELNGAPASLPPTPDSPHSLPSLRRATRRSLTTQPRRTPPSAPAALKAELAAAEERARAIGGLPRTPTGAVDYSKDFFSIPSFLTVSGQLQGEMYACGMSNVYTFGPTFRAENSHTVRAGLFVCFLFSSGAVVGIGGRGDNWRRCTRARRYAAARRHRSGATRRGLVMT